MSAELIFILLLVVLANLVEASDNQLIKRNFPWLLFVLNFPLLLFAVVIIFIPDDALAPVLEGSGLTTALFHQQGVNFLWLGLMGALFSFPLTRQLLARVTKLDPDNNVHALATMLGGYLIGLSIASLALGGLEALADLELSQNIWMVLFQQGLFFALGIFGPGFLVRRNWTALRHRLGLTPLTQRQVLQAIAWIAPLVALQWAAGAIWLLLAPDQVELFDSVQGTLLADIDSIWEWVLLAVATGIGEEILFRGAIQPRFGLWPTVILFTIAHTQYALSPATVVIALLAYILGRLRQQHGTSMTILVHGGYNLALGLIALLVQSLGLS
ncbi:MAG: CPBP family intramembrane metalloprotease [Anaerolineales bacterium]|nr:CPBP family intramembrane metalloprotease [Anaerolineales bacterium]